jgi:hypothetical protein
VGIVAVVAAAGGLLAACSSGGKPATPAASKPATSATAASGQNWIPPVLSFRGAPSAVIGTSTNLFAFMTWDAFAAPWNATAGNNGSTGDFGTGQEAVTDKYTRDGKPAQWTAKIVAGTPGAVLSAPLKGTAALEAYTDAVVNHVILPQDYPAGTSVTPITSESFTLDGYTCWLDAFRPSYKVTGVKATSDTDVVVVANNIDSSGGQLGVLYISIPSDASDLLPDIPATLHSLRLQH